MLQPLVEPIEPQENAPLLFDHLVENAPQAEQDECLNDDEDRLGALHDTDR